MEKGENYDKAEENVDDFYKKKIFPPEKYNRENQMDDFRYPNSKDISNIDVENLEDKWYGMENDYKKKYPNLTDEDVNVEPNNFWKTIKRIGYRRGKSFQEILNEIKNW